MAALTGKVAWVTGAGSGIGQAAAIALAKEGATVVLTGRRKEPLQETAATIKKAGGKAEVKPGDLMKAAAVTKIAKEIEKKYGRCDILVNNAGLNILDRSWAKLTPASAEQVIDGNLSSAFYCTTAVLPMMRKRKDGVLIHTSSMAGRHPSLLSGPAYSAAKHGVVAMSHTINMEECVNGIRSCVVLPGRGGDADPRQAAGADHPGRAQAHGAVGGCRRPDPLRRLPAAAHRDQRGLDQPDLEPRLRRQPLSVP